LEGLSPFSLEGLSPFSLEGLSPFSLEGLCPFSFSDEEMGGVFFRLSDTLELELACPTRRATSLFATTAAKLTPSAHAEGVSAA
jgi:hypothetical protein